MLPFLSLIITLLYTHIPGSFSVCGYGGCPETKEGFLNVHLVPHSHMDMGWLETVDKYYDGDIGDTVKEILDNVVVALQKKESRRFICAETGFFWRWWKDQNDTTQAVVRNLIESGQFEFIHGGWVMNDEAGAHYNEIIDQMTLGLRFLNNTFGTCGVPKVAWQIDPFGHSREQASLFAQMGYDGVFMGRIDYQDKKRRIDDREMEMIWNGSPKNLGKDSRLFTGVLYNQYDSPEGFCYDRKCYQEEHKDWEHSAESFADLVENQWSQAYKSNHVMMAMGSDFQYSEAEKMFSKLDKLIKYTNRRQHTNGSKVNLIYSTPACYLNEVNKANLTFPLKTDDFFPYGSSAHALWTGYFTSRPTLKYFIHKTNNFLQACKQLGADASDENGLENTVNNIQVLSESMAVAQHHDAISGTAQQHVTDDYAKRLHIGIKSCERVIENAFRNIMHGNEYKHSSLKEEENTYEFCQQLNISTCAASESKDEFLLAVYNPLARTLNNSYIRLPVKSSNWKVERLDGLFFPTSVPIPDRVKNIPGRESEADYEIAFPAGALPGLSISYFLIKKLNSTADEYERNINVSAIEEGIDDDATDFHIENSVGLRADFDAKTGLLKSISRGKSIQNVSQNFYYYEGMSNARHSYISQLSGAYVFRPTKQHPLLITNTTDFKILKGKYVTEVHQNFSRWVSQIIRLYDSSDALEFEWIVGPIPVKDEIGKEIVTKYTTDMSTNGVFFTDGNGREMQKRERNYRPTWNYTVNEKVSGNYYPVNSRMIISENEDLASNEKTLIILNDRTQGGTSTKDGEMEIMVHRRLLQDDGFGVSEPLDERAFGKGLVVRGKHWLIFAGGETGIPNSIHRPLAQEVLMDKIIAITESSVRRPALRPNRNMFSQLANILPPNIHLLTLEPLFKDTFLLRLEHIYETGEHPEFSQRVTIKMENLHNAIPFVRYIRETTLAANQWKNESLRLNWAAEGDMIKINDAENNIGVIEDVKEDIVLNPMEIKTYLIRMLS